MKPADTNEFVGALHEMDLSSLKTLTFICAWNKGPRDSFDLMPKTLQGPFSFDEMVEYVSMLHTEYLMNAKVFILSKDAPPSILDVDTIDYIQANATEILMEQVLGGSYVKKQYVANAGLIEAQPDDEQAIIE